MKKTLIIALCCFAVAFASCKKKPIDPTPDDPTPSEDVNYAPNYIGDYNGSYAFDITSMNNQPQTLSFLMDNIVMNIVEGSESNTITATVTVDNETRQTTGTTTQEKINFDFVHLTIDKPDQGYKFALDLKMEGTKAEGNTMNITGNFTGDGEFFFGGVNNVLEEVSGTLSGELVKQQPNQ